MSNNSTWCWFSDSTSIDDDSGHAGNVAGFGAVDYIHSYLALNYPQFNISFYNLSRSGGLMNDEIINAACAGAPAWGYQFNHNQHIGIAHATENGSLASNAMYQAMSAMLQAPFSTTNGTAMTNEGGWSASDHVQWIAMGALPQENASGDGGTVVMRNGAATNAAAAFGYRSFDVWGSLSQPWTNDFNNNAGANVGWFVAPKIGHPGKGGQLNWAFAFLKNITTDTNISTATVDWGGSVVATNHCVVSSVSRSGNILTFTRHDDRLPMAWDTLDHGIITNESSRAFLLTASDADYFKFTIAVQNLPAGMYSVLIDNTLVGVVPNTVLAGGWNMFTNTVGPYWNQRKEVLGRIRNLEYVNRTTLLSGSAGDNSGMVSYRSYAGSKWAAGYRGDALITQMAPKVAQIQTNFAAINVAAQPTNHTFTIMPYAATAIVKVSALTNALNVPVILDGSSSVKASTYYWEQIGGLPQLDMVGQGTVKPMLLSVTNAGTYTFRLTVSDGQTSSSSQVNVTFIQPVGRTIFVDQTLPANCVNNNYSIASRNGGGSDGNAYTNIQLAANSTKPGDVVYIRGGLYTNGPGVITSQNLIMVTNAGTATAPIRFENYNNEHVTLGGWGFSDVDTNGDGLADGPYFPAYRQKLFFIQTNADYIQVKGLEVTNSQQDGIVVEASFCYVSECSLHDNWTSGIGVLRMKDPARDLVGTVLRWVEAYHNRHFTGIDIGLYDQTTFGFVSDCAIVDCISDWNGYQNDGREVMPIGGDPEGGGNAGGFWTVKYFADNAFYYPLYGVRNWGQNIYFVRDIAFNNCDDGLAFDHANSVIEGNETLFNGPTGAQGIKLLRYLPGMIIRGNIAYGNINRGFEMRIDTNASLQFVNNMSVLNHEYGFWYAGVDATSILYATNNVSAYNGQTDWTVPVASIPTSVPNWSADGLNVSAADKGNPMLNNTNLTLSYAFPANYTVRQKHDSLDQQIRKAVSPAPGSPLLNSGLVIPGYHLPFADNDPNNPMSLTAPGRHWKLPAPNMGPFDLFTAGSGTKPTPPTNLRSITNF